MMTNQRFCLPAELRRRFAGARRVVVLTGAGVSAESGVPTFRGGGRSAVWKGMPFDQISSAGMLERNLAEVWEWFDYRRNVIGKLEPNAAHRALVRWQDRFEDFTLVTQNVDGLHQAAGSRELIELHGNLWRARCLSCRAEYDLHDATTEAVRSHTCVECGGHLRPDVVLFGEMLPVGAFERAAAAASICDLCFVVGTSALVYPAAALPEIAGAAGAYTVEVNPERTPLSDLCHARVAGPAGHILPLFED
ncbi:MAG TPA: NAD-dependent deacylase [Pyrinomonadaceae bacterium]|nr:NAD-dependent deacylase [Pyrinomonadaceae bacterium]